jgi:MYXO-CTERM domain-containing protein
VSAPGWYPDPAGGSGRVRYWDGQRWSGATRAATTGPDPTGRRRTWGWAVAGLALLVVLIVVGVFVVRQVGFGAGWAGPTGNPSSDVCPQSDNASPSPQPGDGRVHGGRLSYPQLGAPWGAPMPEYDVAFGRGVLQQFAVIERGSFLGFTSWGAAVLVGELVAGDGFFTPRDGAAIVIRCVTGTFYGNTEVTRDDRRNEAITVDGHQAWVIESNLGFDVPGLQAKHELLIVVVVDTEDGSAGLFSASIPENGPQYVGPARQALAQLRVDD